VTKRELVLGLDIGIVCQAVAIGGVGNEETKTLLSSALQACYRRQHEKTARCRILCNNTASRIDSSYGGRISAMRKRKLRSIHLPDWQHILHVHGPTVWQTVYRVLGRYADACDAYQDTFLDAVKVERKQPVRCWQSLLKRIATTRAIDLLRRRERQNGREANISSAEPVSDEDPVHLTQAAEILETVRSALAKLPDNQAEAFWLHVFDKLDYRETAEALNVTPENARILVHRARNQLLSELGRSCATPQDTDAPNQ